MPNKIVMGIDVSKEWLDLNTAQSGAVRVANTPSQWTKINEIIATEQIDLVVLEASGGYERGVRNHLVEKAVAVSAVNPRQVRDFAKGLGLLAKTDSLDAEVLRTYGELVQLRRFDKLPRNREALAALVKERMHLVRIAGQEKKRLRQVDPAVFGTTKAVLHSLNAHIASLESQIDTLVEKDETVSGNTQLLCQIKGISVCSAVALQALLPELGQVNNKKIAALAGLAPYNRDSGKHRGVRCVWGGREPVRRILWMCTVCAATHNAKIRSFYHRLLESGKPVKVALTACMRKLLVICNAILRDQTVSST